MLTPWLALATHLLQPNPDPDAETRSLAALRVGHTIQAPTVDGRLDDPAWQQAEVAGGFTQYEPVAGAPASQRTEARVLYTEDAIYVAMRMYDTAPDSIVGQLARRDPVRLYSDWAHVLVDSYNDRRTAFRFSVNPRGVKRDVFHFNDTREDASWDAVWDVATRVDSLGWTAEFRIPLSQLRFRSGGEREMTWGVNFGREIARLEERSYWAPIEPNSGRFVSFSGELRGLSGLGSPRQLEVQPYALSRYTRAPGELANPFYRANDLGAAFGMDVKYGLTSDLTLTATFNPDFGQVEADPAEVNLSAFETSLSERRPFFQEGTDIFNSFGLGQVDVNDGERLFYSRRIGRSPQHGAAGTFVDAPDATTILGAAKIYGKTAGGWSVGVLSSLTAQEEARVFHEGNTESVAVEPMAHYGMARVARDFRRGGSTLGGVLTTTHRVIEEGSDLDFLRSAAYVGGFDGRHRFGDGQFQISGSLLGSHVEGSARAIERTQRSSARYFQRPDATHLELDPSRTSLRGLGFTMDVEKIGGGNWRGGVKTTVRTPGFEVNDLGFMRTADAATVLGGISTFRSRPAGIFRNWQTELAGGSTWTTGGERTLTAAVLQGNAQFTNYWGGGGAVIRLMPALSTVALRGGPALHTPARTIAFFGFGSDNRQPLRVGLDGEAEREDGTGGYAWNVSPSLTLRPSSRASLSLAPMYARNEAAWQYLGRQSVDGENRYVGGHLDQTTLALTTRVNYAFTSDLSFQFYAQPFVSAGSYRDLREVASPRAGAFEDRFTPIPEDRWQTSSDFNVKQLRTNAVVRWEYAPGSTLFVVWSQGRQDRLQDGTFSARRDFGRLLGFDEQLGAPATNVLLVKLSYWLDR